MVIQTFWTHFFEDFVYKFQIKISSMSCSEECEGCLFESTNSFFEGFIYKFQIKTSASHTLKNARDTFWGEI